jgi:PiT family inorganic phosphate transporter
MSVLVLIVTLALIFDFLNGIHDSSNIVATMISSKAFRPSIALGVTAVAEFAGPLIFGVAVAKAIGEGIISADLLNIDVLVAALFGSILWNLITWFFGIPSSSSHALIGGIVGAVAIGAGFEAIKFGGLTKVLLALFFSPIIGFVFGFIFTRLIFFLARGASPKINWWFKRSQLITAISLALSHGTNDAQKTMGVITLGLVITGKISEFQVPLWVVLASAGAIALGTSFGGWRLIRTLGGKFYKIRPVHGFSTQMTSTLIILGASLVGGPVSTTQVVSSAIMGVGASERFSKVRWRVAGDILYAWLLTIPATGLLAAGAYWLIVNSNILKGFS